MAVLNDVDRFHLVMDVIDRVPGLGSHAGGAAPAHGGRRACVPRPMHEPTAIDSQKRSAAGPGPTDLVAHPRPERWLELAKGERDRGRQARAAGRSGRRLGLRCDESDRPTKDGSRERWTGWRKATDLADLAGVGHRVVHGGSRFHEPAVIDDAGAGGSGRALRAGAAAQPGGRGHNPRCSRGPAQCPARSGL